MAQCFVAHTVVDVFVTTCRRERGIRKQGGRTCSASPQTETVRSRGRSAAEHRRPSEPPRPGSQGCQQSLQTVPRLAGLYLEALNC